MAILQPDQPGIDLGRSRIRPVETYAPPPRTDLAGGGGGEALGNALASLGGQFESLGSEFKNKQEKADLGSIEYTAGSIRTEIKQGVPFDTQIGALLPEKSSTVRMRVGESLGFDAGTQFAQAELDKLNQDQQLRLNPEAFNARVAEIRKQAMANVQGSPFYGSGYLKSVEGVLGQATTAATSERSHFYDIAQKNQYIRENDERVKAETEGSAVGPITHEVIGHDPASIPNLRGLQIRASEGPGSVDGLNKTFATRLDKMVADMPPEIKAKVTLDSAYRSVEHQAEIYEKAKAEHGADARKWAAPPGHSNHNHGEAVDLGGVQNDPAVREWVHGHAKDYGLYFPMSNEPWHIEMIGGRRDQGGAKNGSGMMRVDGPAGDAGSPVDRVTRKIIGAESGGDTNARNPRSSASGLGQFTDGTWLSAIRSARPDVAMGKSDSQLLALKTDPEIGRSVLTSFTQANADKLKAGGMPVTEGNIYLMHFAGEGAGPKIIKAADGTRIEDVMGADQIAANPFLRGKTVAEVKQWAADKMGQAVPATMRAQNAVRSVDREWSRTSSIGNLARAEALTDHYTKQAVILGDRSVLDRIPPEWRSPDIQDRLDQAGKQADEVKFTQFQHQLTMQKEARAEEGRSLISAIDQKEASGQAIDPTVDAVGKDGRINHEAFTYAKEQRDVNLRLPESLSATNRLKAQDDLYMAAAGGDWGKLGFERAPRMNEIRDYIQTRNDMTSKDKIELQGKLESIMEGGGLSRTPTGNAAFANLESYAKVLQDPKNTDTLGSSMYGINYEREARTAFDAEVRLSTMTAIQDKGEIPRGEAQRLMFERAADKAQAHLDRLVKALNSKGDQQAAVNAEKMVGKPNGFQATKREDGVIVISPTGEGKSAVTSPVVGPQGQPQFVPAATPTAPSAAPAPSPAAPASTQPEAVPETPTAASPARIGQLGSSGLDHTLGQWVKHGLAAVGRGIAAAPEKVGDFMSGDPEQIIADIQSGNGPVKADSPLGKKIIAHQQDRRASWIRHRMLLDEIHRGGDH